MDIACVKESLLHTDLEAQCPKCVASWSDVFLYESPLKGWIHETYRLHRETVAVKRERLLISDMQDEAADVLRERKIDTHMTAFKKRLKEANIELSVKGIPQNRKIALQDTIREIKRFIEAINRGDYDPDTEQIEVMNYTARQEAKIRSIQPCCVQQCRGFLDANWKCKICAKSTCSECGEIKEDKHRCNDKSVASFKMIREDYRPCPKCGIRVTKLSGCSDMFCVHCKTPFCWVTMKIDRQGNSNGLFRDWRDQQRRTRGVDDSIVERIQRIRWRGTFDFRDYPMINDILFKFETINWRVSRFRRDDGSRDLDRLRVKYIIGDITEQKWGHRINLIDREVRAEQYISNTVKCYMEQTMQVIEDLSKISDDVRLEFLDGCTKQITKFREICNINLGKIHKVYQSKNWQITSSYDLEVIR
jgi:hypothetical protein